CSVSGGTSRLVAVTAGQTATVSFTVDCPTAPPPTGSLTVTTSTTGGTLDPDGYTFTVDGGSGRAIGINTSVTVDGLSPGSHTVVLSGIAANCSVSGGTSRTVIVTARESATASFTVDCPPPPPPTPYTTLFRTTTGGTLDPDGYTFTVDGGSGRAIGINTSVTVDGLSPGSHTVILSDIAANCSVSGGTSRTVTVTAGQTATASFSVDCPTPPPPTGDLTVTTSTSGSNQDADGYTVTLDGGTSRSIGTNNSTTFSGLDAGSHTVTLGGVAGNCSVSGGDSKTLNVPAGGTATAAFTITCTALTGDLTVTTSTSGSNQDSDGYTVTLDGGTSRSIGTNNSTTFSSLEPESHTVTL